MAHSGPNASNERIPITLKSVAYDQNRLNLLETNQPFLLCNSVT